MLSDCACCLLLNVYIYHFIYIIYLRPDTACTIWRKALYDTTHANLHGFIQPWCSAVICAAVNVCQRDCKSIISWLIFKSEVKAVNWRDGGWRVAERINSREGMGRREKLPLSNSIVQFQYLSWDIRSSGWISGKIRKVEVFFPCRSKRLKPRNLFANPATAVLLLICPFSGLLRWVICSALGCCTVWDMGFVCSV